MIRSASDFDGMVLRQLDEKFHVVVELMAISMCGASCDSHTRTTKPFYFAPPNAAHDTKETHTKNGKKKDGLPLSLSLFPLIELRQAQHSSCLLGGPSKPEQSQYNNMLVARGFNGCGRQRPCRDVLYHNGSIQSQTRARDMSSCITTTHALLLFCACLIVVVKQRNRFEKRGDMQKLIKLPTVHNDNFKIIVKVFRTKK